MSSACLAPAEILDLFTQEVEQRSGKVTEVYNDGRWLFARSTLPLVDLVRRQDQVQGGVALKAIADEVCVYPYVFREVCRNGAIMANTLGAERLVLDTDLTAEEQALALREIVQACAQPEVFVNCVQGIRTTMSHEADMTISLLPHLAHLPRRIAAEITGRFRRHGDSSRFGLMNAVTSVARDTRDPEQRWRLEELGGAIPAELVPRKPTGSAAARPHRQNLVPTG